MAYAALPNVPGLWHPFAHFDCFHNQLAAIHNRVCGRVPAPTAAGLAIVRKGAEILKRTLPRTCSEPLGQFADEYGGAKRARYHQARDDILANGVSKRDARVTMFVKCEKMLPEKVNPDPRAIQFRDPRYCVAVASFLKPIEPYLYRLNPRLPQTSKTRLVAKGLNQVQRATLLLRKMAHFRRPVVLSLDMSRFDQHCSLELLQIEHSVYLHSNPDPWFRQLLSWQLFNKVYSRIGFKYTTRGKRMSGDMNTALGNCVIMLSMIIGWCVQHLPSFDLLDDGDDCLLIVEEEDLSEVLRNLPDYCLSCGHELKIENIARDIESVVFCQSRPVFVSGHYRFVRDWRKVLSHTLVGTRWVHAPHWQRLGFLAGLAECEIALSAGVPILQEYACALMRNSHGAEKLFDTSSGEYRRYLFEGKHSPEEVTVEARLSFEKAFGVSFDEQLDIEKVLASWDFDLRRTFECAPRDTRTWINDREFFEIQ